VTLLGAVCLYVKNSAYAPQNILVADSDNSDDELFATTTNISTTTVDTEPPALVVGADKVVPISNSQNLPGSERFDAPLQEVNTGCFADGECYIVAGGNHVTLLVGRYQGPLGQIIGTDSIGSLESYIGQTISIYAKKESVQTYTLLGNDNFYVMVATSSKSNIDFGENADKQIVGQGCVVGGCSGQMCGEVDPKGDGMMSTCEWREQYSCFKTATCEKQTTGKCGWTPTKELNMCLSQNQ
jgi:hypothetical protein